MDIRYKTARELKEERNRFEANAFGCFWLSVARVYIGSGRGGGNETTCER